MRSVTAALTRPTLPRPRRALLWAGALATVLVLALLAAGVGPALLGYDTFVAVGGSMEPAIRQGSIIVAKRVDPASVRPGDIISFRRPQRPDIPITHRVISVQEEDGTTVFLTKGDGNSFTDPEEVSVAQPISKLVYTVPFAGYLVSFGRTGLGKALLIGLPALLLLRGAVPGVRRRWRDHSARPRGASPSPPGEPQPSQRDQY